MITIARRFGLRISEIVEWVDIVDAALSLGAANISALDPNDPASAIALGLHTKLRAFRTSRLDVPYEGIFLSACAEFELVIRDLTEKLASDIAATKINYADLPDSIRTNHEKGCASIITKIGYDQFSHLTIAQVVQDLTSCVNQAAGAAFVIRVEAFSLTGASNCKTNVISERMGKLELKQLWSKLSNDSGLLRHFPGPANSVAKAAQEKLNSVIDTRNNIVHRGRSGYSPGSQDVRNCCDFLRILVDALARVLDSHVKSL